MPLANATDPLSMYNASTNFANSGVTVAATPVANPALSSQAFDTAQAAGTANQHVSEYSPADWDPGPAVTQDGQNFRNAIYAEAFAALANVPEGSRKEIAFRIAQKAQISFLNMVRAGIPSSTAQSNARAALSGWVREAAGAQGVAPVAPSTVDPLGGPNAVPGTDVQDARGVYQSAVKQGVGLFGGLSSGPVAPKPTEQVKPFDYGLLAPEQVAAPTGYDPALQRATTVAPTDTSGVREAGKFNYTPDTLQASQVAGVTPFGAAMQDRTAVGAADTRRLEDLAAGRGAVEEGAEASMRLSLLRSQQQRQGLINQARGSERRALRAGELANAGTLDLAAADQLAAQRADRQIMATQKLAEMDERKNALQAQLDAARAANNQAAINDIQKKLADLEMDRQKTNAELSQSADQFNIGQKTEAAKVGANLRLEAESRAVQIEQQTRLKQAELEQARAAGDQNAINKASSDLMQLRADAEKANAELRQNQGQFATTTAIGAQEKEQRLTLDAQKQEEEQRVADARLRMDAQKALEQSAQGLLNEDQRQRALAMAQEQLRLENKKFEFAADEAAAQRADANRRFWTTFITSIIAQGAGMAMGKPPTPAAHGGAVTGPRKLLVGEAGDPEVIVPFKGTLTDRMARLLEVEAKPFEARGDSERVIDDKDALIDALTDTIRTLRERKAPPEDEDDLYAAMNGGIVRGRKQRAVY